MQSLTGESAQSKRQQTEGLQSLSEISVRLIREGLARRVILPNNKICSGFSCILMPPARQKLPIPPPPREDPSIPPFRP